MRSIRFGLMACLLLVAQAVQAQPAGDEAHHLAGRFLDMIKIDEMMPQLMTAMRPMVLSTLERNGTAEDKAGQIYDQFMLPEFKARIPELRGQFEDILVGDFTVPELQAIVNNEQNDARRSAAAKAGQLQGQFSEAGTKWGQAVGTDVYAKHKAEIDQLAGSEPPAK